MGGCCPSNICLISAAVLAMDFTSTFHCIVVCNRVLHIMALPLGLTSVCFVLTLSCFVLERTEVSDMTIPVLPAPLTVVSCRQVSEP